MYLESIVFCLLLTYYAVSAQGIIEHIINVCDYYYCGLE